MKDNKNIVTFEKRTAKEEGSVTITLPSANEVKLLKAVNDNYVKENGKDAMVPSTIWDGDGWKTMFEKVFEPCAKEIDCDAWDVFAVFIAKLRGAEFIEDENGISIRCQI